MSVVIDSHLRCRLCHKRMIVEHEAPDLPAGQVRHVCWNCEFEVVLSAAAGEQPATAPVVERPTIPFVYDQSPFPLSEFDLEVDTSAPSTSDVPEHHERLGYQLFTLWCQRCQEPGQSYEDCTCVLMPDRYVRGVVPT